MIKLLYILLTPERQESKRVRKNGGFTLIELLVGVILAFLVITPLLGFMVNIMNTDRQEQAKTNSDQELQAALDYINRDVQQAVYIYDKEGVEAISSQLPEGPDKTPVLVFWKRKLVEKSNPINIRTTDCTTAPTECNDAFVYSLVAYYLIKDQSTTWSKAARIGRFEIHDGVRKADGAYVDPDDPRVGKSEDFQAFDLTQGETLAEKMNSWTTESRSNTSYDTADLPESNILIDYIDQTNTADANLPSEACPDTTVGNDPGWTQVPDYDTVSETFKTYSFYTCVYSSKNTARVFLRGNALARIEKNNYTYNAQKSAFFPKARLEVRGTGVLSND
jgi:type II secretory pathway pseudopilin PulG